MRTSLATCDRRLTIDTHDGNAQDRDKLDLHDTLVIETSDGQRLEFEIVGIVEDDEQHGYAVCYNEERDEFVVTDDTGSLLQDETLAQEILDDFFDVAEDEEGADAEGATENSVDGGTPKG